jgi:prefoldin alpha subunit
MGKEEYIMQLSMLEQQAREIQQQVALVNQKIGELDVLKFSLNKLNTSKEKEFLAPLGEGVFAKAFLEDKELFVNVGSKIIVKKSIKAGH